MFYISKAGSSEVRGCVRLMLDFILNVEVAVKFNWKGQRSGKYPMRNKILVEVIAVSLISFIKFQLGDMFKFVDP